MALSQHDSTYFVRYPEQLGIAFYQSAPSYDIELSQKINGDSAGISGIDYRTLASNITGFGIHYGKFSLFAGIKTPGKFSDRQRRVKTQFTQLNVAMTDLHLRVEGSARFYTGFYDFNSPRYIPDFTDSTAFYSDAGMKNRSIKLKGFYFPNEKKRFSYAAAYINNERQLRSAGSWILSANVYHYAVIGSKPIVPIYIQPLYAPYDNFTRITVNAVSAGFGYTHTFTIFKRVFLNLLLTIGAEGRDINITGGDKNLRNKALMYSAYDFRSSLGYNSDHFFLSIQTIVDGNRYNMPEMNLNQRFVNTIFIMGYRFGKSGS